MAKHPGRNRCSAESVQAKVARYWSAAAGEYRNTAYKHAKTGTRYPYYEVRLNLVLDLLKGWPKGRLLDAGCGGGNVLIECLNRGWDGYGFDLVEEMVALARENLAAAGHSPERIGRAPISDLSLYPDKSFDVILSLGVMEYIPPADEHKAFAEIRRILKDEGVFVVENINNLFDLVTFNRFTLGFFEEHFLPRFFSKKRSAALRKRIAGLVQYPDKPDRSGPYTTTRDQVFTKSENPLTYADKVKPYGFVQAEQAFYRFHAVPPLLFEAEPKLEKVTVKYELAYSRHWIGNFLASGFVSVLRKQD